MTEPEAMATPVRGTLRHRMPGRIRVALDKPLPGRDTLQALAAALADVEGVEEVEIRPQSGSVIVRHHGEYEDTSRALGEAGLQIEVEELAIEFTDPIQETLGRLSAADAAIQRLTGGRADIWNVAFSALVAGGLIQLARGQVAGPAMTLFGQAATLVMSRPLRKSHG